MAIEIIISIIIFILAVVAVVVVLQRNKNLKFFLAKREADLAKREEETKQKLYEIAILSELSDKMGYSLGAQNVIEIIIGSLKDFIDYSSVSYMMPLPEKLIFRTYLEKPVSSRFVRNVREKMIDSFSALLKEDLKNKTIEENLWGTNINDNSTEEVQSFFTIPLIISGKVTGLICVADARANFYKEKEITAVNKIAEQATTAVTKLQEVVESEKSKLNAMVASMTDGVIMTDMDFRVLVVNPAARKALGFENKNEISISDFDAVLKGKIDLKDKIEESVRLEKFFLSDEIALGNGFFKIAVSPVKDNWKSLGCVAVFRDVTHEKEVAQIKEDFTSMIVHELRSPLDTIKKMIGMLRVSDSVKAKRMECYQMVYSSSSDMLELINNLLDIAKIEAGKFELLKQKSDIEKIIESRILFFGISAKDANVKLESKFGKDIPNDVEFDPHTVSQVLNNLISNAIKFTKENGAIAVQALLHRKGENVADEAKEAKIDWFIKKDFADTPDSLVVAVTDNGVGIAPDQLTKLFNKFTQAKNNFVEKGGTGLGLAITKSIVESHGGIVGAESVEEKGSTFYFTLPINQ